MNIYIACHNRELAVATAQQLAAAGHGITSRWHSKAFLPTDQHTADERVAIALEDYADIEAADGLVLVAGPDKYSGGKFVEAGIAVGLGRTVFVLGHRENMLLWLPSIRSVADISEIVP